MSIHDEVDPTIKAYLSLVKRPIATNTHERYVQEMSPGDKLADRLTAFAGSWRFIIICVVILMIWIGTNIYLLSRPFDPFPFILLNLMLSTIAALQAPVIMMSQNRQAHKDRIRAEHDYQVNLKAEAEIAALHRKVDELDKILRSSKKKA
jgi:uncharacterized membrane protein